MKVKKRPYLIVSTIAQGQVGASTALTREGIMLEMAMRLMAQSARPIAPQDAWKKAEQFVRAMDKKLPFVEPPPSPPVSGNADRPIADVLK